MHTKRHWTTRISVTLILALASLTTTGFTFADQGSEAVAIAADHTLCDLALLAYAQLVPLEYLDSDCLSDVVKQMERDAKTGDIGPSSSAVLASPVPGLTMDNFWEHGLSHIGSLVEQAPLTVDERELRPVVLADDVHQYGLSRIGLPIDQVTPVIAGTDAGFVIPWDDFYQYGLSRIGLSANRAVAIVQDASTGAASRSSSAVVTNRTTEFPPERFWEYGLSRIDLLVHQTAPVAIPVNLWPYAFDPTTRP